MIETEPENGAEIIDGFIEELLDGGDRSTLEEYCGRYPSMRRALEGKFECVRALEEGFKEDNLAGAEIEDYLIVEEIGRGGMGVVYLALQKSLDRYVAFKVLPMGMMPDAREISRFRNEARAASRLSHPNIVPIFSTGEEKGMYYIAMELIQGVPLSRVLEKLKAAGREPRTASEVRDIIEESEDLPRICRAFGTDAPMRAPGRDPSLWDRPYLAFVLSLCSDVSDGLAYAHRNGVCHGDLKPSNIMLSSGGVPMIVDFGLARDVRSLVSIRSQDFLGTLAYASPEHLARNVVNQKSDIWSLGVTMYEMITLRQPFRTDDVAGTIGRISKTDPPPMRARSGRVPKDAEAIVARCLEKGPERRYSDAQGLKDDIDRLLAGRPVKARPIGKLARQLKRARRNPVISLLGAALLVLGLITPWLAVNSAIQKWVSMGTRYYDEGRYSEALRSYGVAWNRLEWIPFADKTRAEVLCDLGNGWSGKGEYEKAIHSYESALKIDPAMVSALIGLGDVYFEIGTYEKSVSCYDRVLLLSPADRNTYYQRGRAYRRLGMYGKALKDFRACLSLAEGDVDTVQEITAVLSERGLSTMGEQKAYLEEIGFTGAEITAIQRKKEADRR
jgi:serine/threonine protein kinase